MNSNSFSAFFMGVLAGILFAICFMQYEKLTLSPSQAEDPDYSTGGTSFYFVSLRKKKDDETWWKNKNGKEEDREEEGETTKNAGNFEINGDEIEEWLGQERGVGSRKKRDTSELSGRSDLHFDVGLDADLLAKVSAPGFDTLQDADLLKDKVKILCIVAIAEIYTSSYGKGLEDTWTKHCNEVLVASSEAMNAVGSVQLSLKSGKLYAWSRTRTSLIEAHDKFLNQFDWFVKVPHNGFVVVENLRHLLLLHQANIPGYIGHVFKTPSGGESVFALSRHALKMIRPSLPSCSASYFHGSDDADSLETCFRNIDVISSMDGRDLFGVFRFQMKVPKLHLPSGAMVRSQWNWRYHIHPGLPDPQCCKEYVVSFNNLYKDELYLLEYSVYHLHPFGIGKYTCPSDTSPLIGDISNSTYM